MEAHAETRHLGHTQREKRRLSDFYSTVKEIFSRCKNLDMAPKFPRGIGIEAEIAVQQIMVRVIKTNEELMIARETTLLTA